MSTLYHRELVTDEFVQLGYEMSIGRFTRVRWSGEGGAASLDRMTLLFQLFPDAEFHVFSNAAHWVQYDQADRINSLVAAFLSA